MSTRPVRLRSSWRIGSGLSDVDVPLGWTPERRAWLDDKRLRGSTYMAGYELVDAVAPGRLRYLPPAAVGDAPVRGSDPS